MNLKKTNTGQVVFSEDLTHLDVNKIELRDSSEVSSDIIRMYHGYVPTTQYVGRQCNYSIWCEGYEIGFFGWGSAVMAMKPRDDFIGWSKQQRLANLNHTATNWRFTLLNNLPKNTATKVIHLSIIKGREDWKRKYGDDLVLVETLVEPPRTGTIYKASKWHMVGMTQGTQYEWKHINEVLPTDVITRRGFRIGDKVDESKVKVVSGKASSKMIFIKPINKRWQKILCADPKCELCISYNKRSECVGCGSVLIRSRLAYFNKWREIKTYDDDLPWLDTDGREWSYQK